MGSGKEHFLYTSERCSWIVPSQSPDVSCMSYSAELLTYHIQSGPVRERGGGG